MASRSHIRNIQRIEAGEQQPGVTVAMRLVEGLGINPSQFFTRLVKAYRFELPVSLSPVETLEISYQIPAVDNSIKSIYGLLLAQARTQAMVSQTAMAKAACYSLRNINAVESGKQEPAIMTAIALILSTGADIEKFFNYLQEYGKYRL